MDIPYSQNTNVKDLEESINALRKKIKIMEKRIYCLEKCVPDSKKSLLYKKRTRLKF